MSNLYGGSVPFMINAGRFGRCRHGHTHSIPRWQCGFWHPFQYLRHLFSHLSS